MEWFLVSIVLISRALSPRGAIVWTSLTSTLDDNTASNARAFTRLAQGSKSLKFVIYIIMLLFTQHFILPVWILCVLYTANKLVALTVTVFKCLNKICLCNSAVLQWQKIYGRKFSKNGSRTSMHCRFGVLFLCIHGVSYTYQRESVKCLNWGGNSWNWIPIETFKFPFIFPYP